MKRRLISAMLALSMLIPAIPGIASAQSDWVAEGTFGSSLTATGLTATSGSTPVVETAGGAETWKIDGESSTNAVALVNIDDTIAAQLSSKNALVEVDYYDNLENGWFYLKYNSHDETSCYTKKEHTQGSKQWKTASFILENHNLANGMAGADFAISTLMSHDYSQNPVNIRAVRVKALDETKPAKISIVTNRAGNIYFSDEDWKVTIETANKLGSGYTADLTLTLKDIFGNVVHTQSETLIIDGGAENSKEIEINYSKFGVYTLHAEAVNAENKYYFSTWCGISYIKKSEFANDKFGVNNKFGYNTQTERDPDTVFSLMQKSGIGWSRDEIFWKDFEAVYNTYKFTDFQKAYLKAAQDHGVKQLIIYGAGNKKYGPSDNTYPATQTQITAFGKYVYNLTKQAAEYGVTDFEILNEFNQYSAISSGSRDMAVYDDICKVVYEKAYEAAKETGTDVNVVGMAASEYNATDFIKIVFDAGGGEYMDAVSYHNYHSGSPLSNNVESETTDISNFISTNYPTLAGIPIWKTEMGWSRGKSVSWAEGTDDMGQAKYIPQEFIIQVAKANLAKNFQYQLIDWNSTSEAEITGLEMCWGMLDTCSGIKNPYGARPAFAAVAAMNSLMGTPNTKSVQTLGDLNVFNFTRAQDGADVGVMWTENGSGRLTLTIPNANVKFYDIYGNLIDVHHSGSAYSLDISDEQVYVVGDYDSVSAAVIRKDDITAASQSYDFNDYTADSLNSAFTTSGSSVAPYKVDDEHAVSAKISGNGALTYQLPEYPAGTTLHLGFDYYQKEYGTTAYDFILSANGRWNGIFTVDADGAVDAGYTEKSTLAKGKWHRFDVMLTFNGDGNNITSTHAEIFMDGEWKGQKNVPNITRATSIVFTTNGIASSSNVCIDNFKIDMPYYAEDFGVISDNYYIYEGGTETVIEFNDTVLASSFYQDTETAFSVIEKNTQAGTNTVISATGAVDGRKFKIQLGSPAKAGCTYSVVLPNTMLNMAGETNKTAYVDIEVIKLVDFYDDFESYAQGAYLKGDLVNGTGFVTWSTTENKWLASEVFNAYSNPIYGKQALYQYYKPEYTFPYAMDSGKFVISFDLVLGGVDAGNKGFVQLMDGTTASQLMGWWDADLHVNYNAQPDGVALQHQVGEWGHYDLVFDFDSSLVEIYFDNTLWAKRPIGNVTGIRFEQSQNNRMALDNFHARHAVENITEFELTGTKTAHIAFRDAVDPSAINNTNITVLNSDLDSCGFTVVNANWYGADLEFDTALSGGEHEVTVSNISGIRGEKLSQSKFTFEVAKEFKINSLAVVDGSGANLSAKESWDKDTAYKISADVINTTGEAKSFWAVVAGFKDNMLIAVSSAALENISKTGIYQADIPKADMADATSIKLFAFDSISGIAPLMTPAGLIP